MTVKYYNYDKEVIFKELKKEREKVIAKRLKEAENISAPARNPF